MDHLSYIKNISLHRWVPAWAEKLCLPWIDNNSQLVGAHQREGKEGEDYVWYNKGPGLRDCWHGDGAKPWVRTACIWRALWVGGSIRLGYICFQIVKCGISGPISLGFEATIEPCAKPKIYKKKVLYKLKQKLIYFHWENTWGLRCTDDWLFESYMASASYDEQNLSGSFLSDFASCWSRAIIDTREILLDPKQVR